MELSLLGILGCGAVIFAILLRSGIRRRQDTLSPDKGKATEIAFAGLASLNLAGMLGLGWFAAVTLFYDGIMVTELTACVVLIAVLAMITAGAFALRRRGKTIGSVALLAVTALPTVAVFGFLIYLVNNQIHTQ